MGKIIGSLLVLIITIFAMCEPAPVVKAFPEEKTVTLRTFYSEEWKLIEALRKRGLSPYWAMHELKLDSVKINK